MRVRIRANGRQWYKGKASCVLTGNVGTVLGSISMFEGAKLDDGQLHIGVLNAKGVWQWARALGRIAQGQAQRSAFLTMTVGRAFDIRLDRKMPYELDGGERKATRRLRVTVDPGALTLCVPEPGAR
jgi:diacylglycerol kinase family enzyme